MDSDERRDIVNDRKLLEKLANAEKELVSSKRKFRFLFDYSSDEIFLAEQLEPDDNNHSRIIVKCLILKLLITI